MPDGNKKNYRDTLNLPKTSFSMKADLVQREPQLRKDWAKMNIYAKIRQARHGAALYTLHDGPPYANGDIHMGHVINKVLKDIRGQVQDDDRLRRPLRAGLGLPRPADRIEGRRQTSAKKFSQMSKLDIRRACMKYAGKYVKIQSEQFQELGVFGDFENPYLTFKPAYEAGILEVFAELVDKGLVYKQLKPIHWSIGARRPWPRRSWSTRTSRRRASSSIFPRLRRASSG